MHINLLPVALVFGAAVSGLALRPENGASIRVPSGGKNIEQRSANHESDAPLAKAPRDPTVEPRLLSGVDPENVIGSAVADLVEGAISSDSPIASRSHGDAGADTPGVKTRAGSIARPNKSARRNRASGLRD